MGRDRCSDSFGKQIYAVLGWHEGTFPPGKSDPTLTWKVVGNLYEAHTQVYHALKRLPNGADAKIGKTKTKTKKKNRRFVFLVVFLLSHLNVFFEFEDWPKTLLSLMSGTSTAWWIGLQCVSCDNFGPSVSSRPCKLEFCPLTRQFSPQKHSHLLRPTALGKSRSITLASTTTPISIATSIFLDCW